MRALAVLLAAIAMSLSACGSAPGAQVLVKGFRFQPKEVTVAVGQTVGWSQEDDTTHTVTSGTPGEKSGVFDSRLRQGEEFTFAFDEPGTIAYFCAIHPEGMRGTIRVR